MKKYKVYCTYIVHGEAIVEAASSEEACELVEQEEGLIEDCGFDDWEITGVDEMEED